MKEKRLCLFTAFCLLCSSSLSFSAQAVTVRPDVLEEQYADARRTVISDDGMLQSSLKALLNIAVSADEYFLSTEHMTPDIQHSYSSDYLPYETYPVEITVNSRRGESAVFYTESPADADAAEAVLRTYFPDADPPYSRTDETGFLLTDHNRQTLSAIQRDLTEAGLLTCFYEHVPDYQQNTLFVPYLTGYADIQSGSSASKKPPCTEDFQAYLNEKNLHCSILTEALYEYDIYGDVLATGSCYYIIPDEHLSFPAHWDLMLQIYHDLGLVPYMQTESYTRPDAAVQICTGLPCDVNADAACTAGDAAALIRWLLTDGTLTDPQAADLNGDGRINAADLALIKRVLLAEPLQTSKELIPAPIRALSPSLPSVGTDRIPVFAVSFPDYAFPDDRIAAQLQNDLFGGANPADPIYPHESAAAYYERASYCRLKLTGDIFRYTAAYPISRYEIKNGQELVREILTAFDDQINYADYDADGNQELDAFVIVLPDDVIRIDRNEDSVPDWRAFSANATFSTTFDGIGINNYCVSVCKKNNHAEFIRETAHELGHAMGLPDYYYYSFGDGAAEEEGLKGSAGYELMDDNTGDLSACSKLLLGWLAEDEVQVYSGGTQSFLLQSSPDSPSCIMIPKDPEAGFLSEYFLIEYLTPESNQPVYGGSGIRILHVQAAVSDGNDGPELTYSNYGLHYDRSNRKQRVLRLVNGAGGLYPDGGTDRIDGQTEGFHWYDEEGGLTAETGLEIRIGTLHQGPYYDPFASGPAARTSGICQITVSETN